jgi:CelD/BcsL family acetyltransferase involved in cellulose biosynthesis
MVQVDERKIAARSTPVEVTVHRGSPAILEEFAAEWNELSSNAVEDQPFFRPAWIQAYFRCFEPQARILLITARVEGDLVLILPLVEEIGSFSKIPLRRLRAPVNYCCSRFDAVRRAGLEGEAAISSTWEFIRKLGGWDLLMFRDALEGSTVGRLAACAQQEGLRTLSLSDQPSPFINVPLDPTLFQRMPANSKLRSQIKQIRTRIKELGELNFSCVRTADPAALEHFYHLEAKGWKGRSPDGLAVLKSGTRSFYDEVANSAAREGCFSLYSLGLNGTLIAAHYCLTTPDHCYSPKVAYNEDYKQFAPGHLIVAEILKNCAERGIHTFDITGQNQPWKMKWTSQARSVSHHYIFKGPLGAVAHQLGSRFVSEKRIGTKAKKHSNED